MFKKDSNIVIISPEYPPKTNWGGVATYNQNLAKLLNNLGYKVHVITYNNLGKEEDKIQEGVLIHYLAFKTNYRVINFLYYKIFGLLRIFSEKTFPSIFFSIDWNFFALFLFGRLHKKYLFKAIFSPTYNAPSLLISFFYPKIPLIIHLHGPQSELNKFEEESFDKKIRAWIEDLYATNFSYRAIACSKYLYRWVIRKYPKIKKKTFYIPNFIDTSEFENKNSLNRNNLVYFGRLEFRKGIDLLVKTFISLAKKNKKIKLWIIGDDGGNFSFQKKTISFYNWFSNLKIEKNILDRIHIISQVNEKKTLIEILTMLKGIAIFPSRYEPFGFVNIEAMAIGFMVVSSRLGSATDIIDDSIDGFITSPSEESLTFILKKILKLSPKKSREIAKNAVIKASKKFDIRIAQLEFRKRLSVLIKE